MARNRWPTAEETAYWQGKLESALEVCRSRLAASLSPEETVSLLLVQGMAAFDSGRVTESLEVLSHACEVADAEAPHLSYQCTISLLSRVSQFRPPKATVSLLLKARQRAHLTGTASALGSLHLVVARLEATRGLCVDSRRHLELAKLLLRQAPPAAQSAIHQVDAGLETYAGNLQRAKISASKGLELAYAHALRPIQAGCLVNLGSVLLFLGRLQKAREALAHSLPIAAELPAVQHSALDTLTQLALHRDDLEEASRYIDECAVLGRRDSLPARSWADLAHQITRCSYHEQQGDWEQILAIVEDASPEAERRQYRAVHTALLCARARALAHMQRHTDAERVLAAAVKACPRSAVDPLIVLEASKGLCATLRGEPRNGTMHFDRALAGCQAIGHRYHEKWIESVRTKAMARHQVAVSRRLTLDSTDAALVLNDVATILGAGHSVDLMAHRLVTLIESTDLGARVTVKKEGDCEYQAEPSVTWEATSGDGMRIRLRGSDRRIDVHVASVRSIEEFSFLRSLSDIVRAGVHRTTETEHDEGDDNLWPLAATTVRDDVVLRSPRMMELLKVAVRLASTEIPVLITGETGTGKEVFARLIHENSRGKRGPFVPFNCATVPRDLMESQLFGHRRGAFTGAHQAFPGLFRSAEGGTLFLDEIGDLELSAQPKLLRFLESGEIQPLGEVRPQRVSVRLIAATNANLAALTREGRFRHDLFYRLGTTVLALPPLRERKDEIPALASFFLNKSMAECKRSGVRLGDDFVAALLLYDWPGNIRELAHEIRRAVALAADNEVLGAHQLAPDIARLWLSRGHAHEPEPAGPTVRVRLDQTLDQALADLEERFIAHALASTGGRMAEAAQLLGLSRKGLFLKRRRRGMLARKRNEVVEA
jgi:DNA-binding NtrC family response regulator/tetratricopeptide (TPR) repeat protein